MPINIAIHTITSPNTTINPAPPIATAPTTSIANISTINNKIVNNIIMSLPPFSIIGVVKYANKKKRDLI